MITIKDVVKKRRELWIKNSDIGTDRQFVRAAARKILETPALVAEVRNKPYLLIECCFSIVNKEKKTVPFFLNEVQRDFLRELETRGTDKPFFVLKGRQQGFTSLVTAIQLACSVVQKNFAGFTMADRTDNTMAIFNDKARVVYDRLPPELKPHEKFNSRNEMFFDKLNSSWRIATATDQVGRSRTLNFVHFSEVAFYECSLASIQKGIGEAITNGSIVVYETTANGFNEAKELWDSGSCHNLFYEWWRTAEYRSKDKSYLETTDSWLSARIKVLREKGLDEEQVAWYAKKYASYIDKSAIRQEYPCTPDEAFVASGESVFDKESLGNALLSLAGRAKRDRRGKFNYKKTLEPVLNSDGEAVDEEWKISDITFIETPDGPIKIHEEPQVKKDSQGEVIKMAPYALGGDTAGTGKDFFTGKVICCLNGKTVATLRKQRMDDIEYAEQMYCLGTYYHDAIIGIEVNYSRLPTRALVQRYGYTNMYIRERMDTVADRVVKEYGFETTPKTKPIIIGELVEFINANPGADEDEETLKEMLTFVKQDNGSMGAISGAHDDLVMALAIAHFISKKQTSDWQEVKRKNNFIEENFGPMDGAGNVFGYW